MKQEINKKLAPEAEQLLDAEMQEIKGGTGKPGDPIDFCSTCKTCQTCSPGNATSEES